jgi:toxin FitB
MDYVVLDTDVASLTFRRNVPPSMKARLSGKVWILTFVTVGEMTQWVELRDWGPRNRASLFAWLNSMPVIDASREAAHVWGNLSADGKRRGQTTPINDTWIAACCLSEGVALATLNLKDYSSFTEHHGLTLVGAT